MTIELVHALVLTPFEAALSAHTFEELLAEDYPIHLVYCPTSGKQIFFENPIDGNPMEKISLLQNFANSTGIQLNWRKQILVSSEFKDIQEQLTKSK